MGQGSLIQLRGLGCLESRLTRWYDNVISFVDHLHCCDVHVTLGSTRYFRKIIVFMLPI